LVRYDDGGPGTSSPQIHVDIGGLPDFAAVVRGHVDGSLRDEVRQAFDAYGQGVLFGYGWSSHSGDVRAARLRYHKCLSTTSEALADILNSAQAMVTAAEEVARRYSDSDALAAISAQDVTVALTQAYSSARVAQAADHARERRFT
jgi:hypothetical protein